MVQGRSQLPTKLVKEAEHRGAARTTVCPEYHIVLVRIAAALKESEEEMSGFDIDVASIRPIH